MNYITVVGFIGDTVRTSYHFWLQDTQHIWLDRYIVEERVSRRHSWKIKDMYSRLEPRNSTIKEEEVDLSGFIKNRVRYELIKNLQILKWGESK